MTRLANYKRALAIAEGTYNHAARSAEDERAALVTAKDRIADVEEARAVLQTVAQSIQQAAHRRIAAIVSKCLVTVFDEPYTFAIEFEQRRGKTEADLVFYRDGHRVDPVSAAGGGVLDVAAFALRLASIVLVRPKLRRLMCLDEPFRFVSAEYQVRVREMLLVLAAELEVQFVVVTHETRLQCGTVIEIGD